MKNIRCTTFSAAVNKNIIWFNLKFLNVLCAYNIIEKKVMRIAVIPFEFQIFDKLYSSIVASDKTIYMIPSFAEDIILYDIESNCFKKCNYEKTTINKEMEKFVAAYRIESEIWCVPGNYSYIITIDMKSGEVRRIFNWKKCIGEEFKFETEDFFINSSVIDERNNIYACVGKTDIILKINPINKTIEKIKLGLEKYETYPECAYINNHLFYYSNVGGEYIYKFSLEENKIEDALKIEEKDLILRSLQNRFLLIDYNKKNYFDLYDETFKHLHRGKKDSSERSRWYDTDEDHFVRIDGKNGVFELRTKTDSIWKEKVEIQWESIKDVMKYIKYPIFEGEHIELLEYINYIKSDGLKKDYSEYIGKNILRKIKGAK